MPSPILNTFIFIQIFEDRKNVPPAYPAAFAAEMVAALFWFRTKL